MSVTVLIRYKDGTQKSLNGVEESKLEKIIEHHSKPINGEVEEVIIERGNKTDIDIDGYYAYMNSLEK